MPISADYRYVTPMEYSVPGLLAVGQFTKKKNVSFG